MDYRISHWFAGHNRGFLLTTYVMIDQRPRGKASRGTPKLKAVAGAKCAATDDEVGHRRLPASAAKRTASVRVASLLAGVIRPTYTVVRG
eukprot:1117328-Pleurochrysis_carterae.AAC.1